MSGETESQIDWRAYYNREPEIKRFVPHLESGEESRVRFVRSLFPSEPLAAILDAGCGDGHQCEVFADRANLMVGADISVSRVRFAREHSTQARFLAAELLHLPFRPRSFDLVMLVEVLEHMEQPVTVLRNLVALSRRYLLVTVPYKQKPQVVMCPHCLKPFPIDGHLQTFDEPSLRNTLSQVGVRVLKLDKFFPPAAWEMTGLIRRMPRGSKESIRRVLQATRLIASDNAIFIGALCEVG